jgi:MraZ protein
VGACGKRTLSQPGKWWKAVKPLCGNHEVSIDDKNRLLIPAEIRKAINPETDGDALFLVPGINGKPWLYPEKLYEAFALRSVTEINPEEELLAWDHITFAMATRLEWDKQGRILIPEKVFRKSGLQRDVTVIGSKDHVEIWNRPDWERQEQEYERQRAEIIKRGRIKSGTGTHSLQAMNQTDTAVQQTGSKEREL